MLDCSALSKPWWGEAILIACFVLNRVPSSKGEITPYKGWKGRKTALGFMCAWGCLAKVNVPTCKKHKLGPKTMDCIFLGYAQHSATYKFLIIKSKIPDVHANMTESCDATFFENIFPTKDSAASSSQPTYISAPDNNNNNQAFYSQASWGRLEMKPHEQKKPGTKQERKIRGKQRAIKKPNKKKEKRQ
jgi:hypothetical protein